MSDEVRTEDAGTYQMLWDCPACDTAKLLGLTHRHCPACGSPQDPNARYFPSDEDKVAVVDHPLVGRDRICPACSSPCASSANNCGNCGSPLDGAKQAEVRDDIVLGQGERFAGETGADARQVQRDRRAAMIAEARGEAAPAKPGADAEKQATNKKVWFVLGGIVAIVVAIAVLLSLEREVEIEATGHSWERTVAIEQFSEVSESAWCERMPTGARLTSRKSEVKSTKKVKDGETCKTRKKDMGNGTFKEIQECTPKYREDKIYADKCYYRIDKWHVDRTAKAQGTGREPAPTWPAVELRKTGKGNCRGCEREGSRGETYTVTFTMDDGDTDTCDFGLDKWGSIAEGDAFTAQAGRMTGNLDCDSLVAK